MVRDMAAVGSVAEAIVAGRLPERRWGCRR